MAKIKTPSFDFVTPAGRLVGGSFTRLNETDHESKPIEPNKFNWWVGLAFPKTATNWYEEQGELGQVFTAIRNAAGYYVNGETQQPTFAWKVMNGDDPKYANKEGYAGHWIIGFSRNVAMDPVEVYKYPENTKIIDPNQLKGGYFYRISGSSSANGRTGNQAGVYVNMQMTQLLYAGPEISFGPAPSTVFNAPVAMPAGATVLSNIPAPAANIPVPGVANVPVPAAANIPVPGVANVPAPVAMTPITPPAPGGTPAPVTPPPAAPAPVTPPPAAPQHVMTAKAGGATYEQCIGAGWTDALLISEGMMLPPTTPATNFLNGAGY